MDVLQPKDRSSRSGNRGRRRELSFEISVLDRMTGSVVRGEGISTARKIVMERIYINNSRKRFC